jgi:hypothetical protein
VCYTVRILTLYGDVLVEPIEALDEALALAWQLDSDLGSTLALVEVLNEQGERIAAEIDLQAPVNAVEPTGSARRWRNSG